MTRRARCERTTRMLSCRISELSVLRVRGRVYQEHVERLRTATDHAVALGLVTAEDARQLWASYS